ncbi:MAG: hypothetical protein QOI80_894 [Solirubrobacteraceae bacterium]|jgi:quercetin dioxygenase-like cupin family protein|nr:hypothetical protein [Solirubrobacteraceae bacterium]
METIRGCSVITATDASGPTTFGPAEANNAYLALVGSFPPGEPGPPPHLHPSTDELFYVAAGEATFLLVDEEVRVTAGGLVFVPRGTVHTVSNHGDVAVHGLILISPGDAEHEFVPVED